MQSLKIKEQKEKWSLQYGNTEMMIAILSILDDFQKTIKEIAKSGKWINLKGVELIYQKFKNIIRQRV